LDQELKAIALRNLTNKLSLSMGKGESKELFWARLDEFGRIKEALTPSQIQQEIENETETGEGYLLAAAVDPNKTEEENRAILSKFIGRKR
jgi:hypothetical protein